jgi:rubrerythrin
VPLPESTPDPQTPVAHRYATSERTPQSANGSAKRKCIESMTASEKKRDKKDRKAYSTAGRPRIRGQYKCGKCGFAPKKQKVRLIRCPVCAL